MKLRPLHRARRFFGSLRPGAPGPADLEFASERLSAREYELFTRMAPADQRHSVGVARATIEGLSSLGDPPTATTTRRAVAAALLHDVGKSVAGLGTYGRVVATLSGWVGGLAMADVWQQRSGFTRRVGLYLNYPQLGADLLEINGADEWSVAWAREHHLGEAQWSLPVEIGRILQAADR